MIGGVGLLVVFGVMAVASPEQRCACAGRLAALSPLVHTIVVAAMLAASGACLRAPAHPAEPQRSWRERAPRWAVYLAILLAVAGTSLAGRGKDHGPDDVVADARVESVEAGPMHLAPRPAADRPPEADVAPGGDSSGGVAGPGVLGVVLEPGGAGIEGCPVFAYSTSSVVPGVQGAVVVRATTQKGGRFALDADAPSRLVVACPGWCVAEFDPVTVRRDDRGLVLTLDPGLSITGRVVDETGSPVPGARVQARGRDGADWGWAPREAPPPGDLPETGEATSDALGQFSIRGLAPGKYDLLAWKRGYGRARHGPGDGNPSVEADTHGLLLTLRRSFRIRVDLVDVEGEPAVGAYGNIGIAKGEPWDLYSMFGPMEPEFDSFPVSPPFHVVRRDLTMTATADAVTATAVPVDVVCGGLGWESRRVQVVPRPAAEAEAEPVRVVLRGTPTRERARVAFRLDGLSEVTGSMEAGISRIGDPPGSFLTPLWFSGGLSQELALPEGVYVLRLETGAGSLLPWHRPLGREAARFTVEGRGSQVVPLAARGGRVLLAPTNEQGQPVGHFYVVARGGMDVQWWTEDSSFPMEETTVGSVRGRVLWFAPGTHQITLRRRGGGRVTSTVTVPGDGTIQVLAPVLPRSP